MNKSLNPRYWYLENGKIKKFIYCRLCLDGPFKESEEKEKFFSFGKRYGKNLPAGLNSSGISSESYCLKCAKTHNYFRKFE